jgi:multisubunit Na+/H+ antiporter MnhE subunit
MIVFLSMSPALHTSGVGMMLASLVVLVCGMTCTHQHFGTFGCVIVAACLLSMIILANLTVYWGWRKREQRFNSAKQRMPSATDNELWWTVDLIESGKQLGDFTWDGARVVHG